MRKHLKLLKKKYVIKYHRRAKLAKRLRKHPAFFVPMMTFGILLTVCVIALLIVTRGNNPIPELQVSNSRAVILSYDDKEEVVPTNAETVQELLDRLKITLNTGDIVEPAAPTEIVSDNFRVNIYRALPVTIIDGSTEMRSLSAATTPRSMLTQANIAAYPEDLLQLAPVEDFITQGVIGQTLTVVRSSAVNLNLYGTPIATRTQAKTVRQFLAEKSISLADGETVQPSIDAPISSSEPIFVNRKGVQVVTQNQDIGYSTQYVEDPNLSFGATALRQQGVAGKRIITYQVNIQTGAQTKLQEITIQEPIARVMARGTYVNIPSDKQAVMAAAGISRGDYSYVDFIISHESRWNAGAQNKSSGAYGLCQALPATKMASAGADYRTNAVTQMKWCSGYATGRYGSWAAAYNFWVANRWW